MQGKDTLRGTARLNWGYDKAIETWDGLTVSGVPPRVTVIDVSLRLNGSLPSSLGNLSNLRELDLSYQRELSGNIPESLGYLSNLERLDLSANRLSGSIPASLGNLSNLQELSFVNNELSGSIPHELGDLSNLRGLRPETTN